MGMSAMVVWISQKHSKTMILLYDTGGHRGSPLQKVVAIPIGPRKALRCGPPFQRSLQLCTRPRGDPIHGSFTKISHSAIKGKLMEIDLANRNLGLLTRSCTSSTGRFRNSSNFRTSPNSAGGSPCLLLFQPVFSPHPSPFEITAMFINFP